MEQEPQVKRNRILCQVIEPAFVLLLAVRWGSLPSKRKLAVMLGLDRRLVGRWVNRLVELGFMLAIPGKNGYRLNEALSPELEQVVRFFCLSRQSPGNLTKRGCNASSKDNHVMYNADQA